MFVNGIITIVILLSIINPSLKVFQEDKLFLISHYFPHSQATVLLCFSRAFATLILAGGIPVSRQLSFAAAIDDKKRMYFISDYRSNFDRTNNFPPANGIMRAVARDFPALKPGTFWFPFARIRMQSLYTHVRHVSRMQVHV